MNEHKNVKQPKAAISPLSKLSLFSNHIIYMKTKGPIKPGSDGSRYIHIIVDHFCFYIVKLSTLGKRTCPLC